MPLCKVTCGTEGSATRQKKERKGGRGRKEKVRNEEACAAEMKYLLIC